MTLGSGMVSGTEASLPQTQSAPAVSHNTFQLYQMVFSSQFSRRSTHGLMVNVLVFGLEASVFEIQSRYYVHFWTNTLDKAMNPLICHPHSSYFK